MYFRLTPNQYFFQAQDARHTLSNLDGVNALVGEAIDFSSQALEHSILSRGAASSCLELYVRSEIDYGRGRANQNIEYADEGMRYYMSADDEMAGNSNSNAAAAEGKGRMTNLEKYNEANGGGPGVCSPENPMGSAEVNYSFDPEEMLAKSFAEAREAEQRPYGPYPIEK
ncbi:hypothetical protein [Dermabacter hominis]